MRKIHFKKDVLPHLVAVVVFLALTIFFFQPVFFDGKVLSQSDILQWQGGAKELLDYRAETGEEGLWTNSMFGGMPGYMVSVKWGNQLIKSLHAVVSLGLPHPVRIIFVCMISFYIMLLCFKVRPYVAIAGAIAFAFSSYQIIGLDAGHNARISAISFMPMVMGAIHLCFTGNRWLGASLTTLALAMQMRVNHLQITYYLAMVVGIYGLIMLIYAYREGRLMPFMQRLGLLAAAALLAVGTYFGEFVTSVEYGKYSNRGSSELTVDQIGIDTPDGRSGDSREKGLPKSYAFQYSNGTWDPMTLFIPNILAGKAELSVTDSNVAEAMLRSGFQRDQVVQQVSGLSNITYWGNESPTTYYAGAIMVFLFVVGIVFVERKYVIWLIAVAILGILLSYGRNFPSFNYFLFDYFPGYNKFRSVTFTIVLPIMAIGLLGMLGLEKLLSSDFGKKERKKLLIALGATGGLSLVIWLAAGIFSYEGAYFDPSWPDWLKEGMKADRKAILRADALRSFLFIALFAGVYYFHQLGKLSKTIAYALFVVLVGLDVILVAQRFMDENRFQNSPAASYFQEYPGDKYIAENESPGDRVIDLSSPLFYDARASYFHSSINGYHGARIKRFQELLDEHLLAEYTRMKQNIQAGMYSFANYPLMNMLNARFVMGNPTSPRGIFINDSANGPAWFVNEVQLVNSANEEFTATPTIDNKSTAVIDASEFNVGAGSLSANGSIRLEEYHPGYWKYQTSNTGNGVAVFSEIYYPKGFEVTIDGQPVEMMRANYILRALEVPAGEHTIEFRFAPAIYSYGTVIMQICSVLALLFFVFTVYLSLRAPKEA